MNWREAQNGRILREMAFKALDLPGTGSQAQILGSCLKMLAAHRAGVISREALDLAEQARRLLTDPAVFRAERSAHAFIDPRQLRSNLWLQLLRAYAPKEDGHHGA